MKPLLKVLSTTWSTHKITSVTVQQADHTQVIDSAATKVGRAAKKAFLFVVHKEIQGWHNFTTLCSWGLSKVEQRHGPIFDEVKGSAAAVYHKGCQQETEFVQALIKSQLTDRIDARWQQHDKAFAWFKTQTQAFLADELVEDVPVVKAEDQAPNNTEDLEQVKPVAEDEESITILDESSVPVLDPPVETDPLDDELSIPTDPAPVPVSSGSKRRSAKKKVEASLSGLIRKEAAKS